MNIEVERPAMYGRYVAIFLLAAGLALLAAGCGSDESRKATLTTGEGRGQGEIAKPEKGDDVREPKGADAEPAGAAPKGATRKGDAPPGGNPGKTDAHLEEELQCEQGDHVIAADALLIWPPKGGHGQPEDAKAKRMRPEFGLGKPEDFKETKGKPESKEFIKDKGGKKVASLLVVKYGPNWITKAYQVCTSALEDQQPPQEG